MTVMKEKMKSNEYCQKRLVSPGKKVVKIWGHI